MCRSLLPWRIWKDQGSKTINVHTKWDDRYHESKLIQICNYCTTASATTEYSFQKSWVVIKMSPCTYAHVHVFTQHLNPGRYLDIPACIGWNFRGKKMLHKKAELTTWVLWFNFVTYSSIIHKQTPYHGRIFGMDQPWRSLGLHLVSASRSARSVQTRRQTFSEKE